MEIRGLMFPIGLILMGNQGVDVILGMNGLQKYQGVTYCKKR
jgi:hypothetical protein